MSWAILSWCTRALPRKTTRLASSLVSTLEYPTLVFIRRNLYTQVAENCRIGDGVQLDDFCRIGANTVIGENTRVGRFTEIGSHCRIGSFVRIDSHVLVDSNTQVGNHCTVYPFAVLGYPPQDKKYKGEETSLEIGNRCQIREGVKVERGTSWSNKTVIGDDVLLMSNVYVGHDSWIGEHVTVANNVSIAGHVKVFPFAVIGGHCALHQFVRIGRGAMIGGMSAIRRDVPPFCLVTGTPPRLRCLNYHQIWKKVGNHPQRKWMKRCFDYLFLNKEDDAHSSFGPHRESIFQRAQNLLFQYALQQDVACDVSRDVIREICTFILDSRTNSVRGLLTGDCER